MRSQNSLKKSMVNLSIFTRILTDDIFQDWRFVQLMNLLISNDKNLHKYTYCFYCDATNIKTNIFIPVFHTIYMGCQKNNILIKDYEDIWIKDLFPHNQYYVLTNKDDSFDYSSKNISVIKDIKDIDGVI